MFVHYEKELCFNCIRNDEIAQGWLKEKIRKQEILEEEVSKTETQATVLQSQSSWQEEQRQKLFDDYSSGKITEDKFNELAATLEKLPVANSQNDKKFLLPSERGKESAPADMIAITGACVLFLVLILLGAVYHNSTAPKNVQQKEIVHNVIGATAKTEPTETKVTDTKNDPNGFLIFKWGDSIYTVRAKCEELNLNFKFVSNYYHQTNYILMEIFLITL